jgi:PBP1b-binding outer membrane lipoprotein LpoB
MEFNQEENQEEKKPVGKIDFLARQEKMTSELEEKKVGLVVDDTIERQKRQIKLVDQGKVKASIGKLSFMTRVNAKYLSQGKPQPYPNEVIEKLQAEL